MEPASLHVDTIASHRLAGLPPSWWAGVLGIVGFENVPTIAAVQAPVTASMTPALGGPDGLCEVWRVVGGRDAALSTALHRHGRVDYRCSDELLFGSVLIDEDDLGEGAVALLRATTLAYEDIFAVLEETRHPHLIRVWNTLPEINRETDGDERYRHFNSARQRAFRNSGRSTVGTVPAASALGSPTGSPVSIYFLAARAAPTMIENPRQTSAYHYPPKFGTHSPVFSRACVLNECAGTTLFVSGTASIVGHETLHHGDVSAQTRETLANIDALLEEANRVVGARRYSLDMLKFKVYVRHPTDLPLIDKALSNTLRGPASIVYLRADVCREDLLVEIEATGGA
jgi:enamine deaminase RidA (YjgF/YER057c/UK114 family)